MLVRRYNDDGGFDIELIDNKQNEQEKTRIRDEIVATLRENDNIDSIKLIEIIVGVDMQCSLARDAADLQTRTRDLLIDNL